MATLTPLTCTNCGAALPSAPAGQPLTCTYCGTPFQPTAPSVPIRQLSGPRCPVCNQNDQTELVARAALRYKAQRDPIAPLLAQLDQPENPQKRGLGGLLRNVTGGAEHKQQVADYEAALALWQKRDAAYRRGGWG